MKRRHECNAVRATGKDFNHEEVGNRGKGASLLAKRGDWLNLLPPVL